VRRSSRFAGGSASRASTSSATRGAGCSASTTS
jgi:hypothetical protein